MSHERKYDATHNPDIEVLCHERNAEPPHNPNLDVLRWTPFLKNCNTHKES